MDYLQLKIKMYESNLKDLRLAFKQAIIIFIFVTLCTLAQLREVILTHDYLISAALGGMIINMIWISGALVSLRKDIKFEKKLVNLQEENQSKEDYRMALEDLKRVRDFYEVQAGRFENKLSEKTDINAT